VSSRATVIQSRLNGAFLPATILGGMAATDLLIVENEWQSDRSLIMQELAELEDACPSVSVGGMACDLDLLPPVAGEAQHIFGRLIELARRKKSLTVEQLAQQANIDLGEIVQIESQVTMIPRVRTVFQLAKTLGLPEGRLMEVAGLAKSRPEIDRAAI
jgi:DNA-binding XRE family transcriptional regulator